MSLEFEKLYLPDSENDTIYDLEPFPEDEATIKNDFICSSNSMTRVL